MEISVFTAAVAECSVAGLTAEEAARATAMASPKRRAEFASGRHLMRQGLQHVHGDASRAWRIALAPSGLLQLEGTAAPAISLSHSHGLAAFACGAAPRLGVDIERNRPRRHIAALAAHVMHADEHRRFAALDTDAAQAFFYSVWVRKEALGKALGCGVGYALSAVCLDDASGGCTGPESLLGDASQWRFSMAELTTGHLLGLAWEAGPAAPATISIRSLAL